MGVNEIMLYTEQDMLTVLKSNGRTMKSAEEDAETIQNWMKTQPHLPEIAGKGE